MCRPLRASWRELGQGTEDLRYQKHKVKKRDADTKWARALALGLLALQVHVLGVGHGEQL